MAKETCTSCDARLTGSVSFCPSCSNPTKYASDAERLEWDLRQWRSHVDRKVAAGINPSAETITRYDLDSPVVPRAPLARVLIERPTQLKAPLLPPLEPDPRARRRMPRVHVPKPHLPRRARSERARVIELDADHDFVYRACATCGRSDWILRGRRNEDGTWNYWCVRCSRTFKTDLKLSHAIKPFLAAGTVVGGILAASVLMLH